MSLSGDLEREHREIDQGIESFTSELAEAAGPRAAVLIDALDELRRHIYFEEELLFPPLQEAGLVPPLIVMRREHGDIWASMDDLTDGLASGADAASLRAVLDRLTVQLEIHNSKEEAIVYSAADGMIPEGVQDELRAQIGSVHQPDRWVCHAARQ